MPVRLVCLDKVKGEGAGGRMDLEGLSHDILAGAPHIGAPFAHLVARHVGWGETFFEQVRDYFRRLNPSAVLLTSDQGMAENAILSAAVALRIPTVLLQDGLLSFADSYPRLVFHVKRLSTRLLRGMGSYAGPGFKIYGLNGADYILTSGNYFAGQLLGLGLSPEKVLVVGQPKYDSFFQQQRVEPRRQRGASLRLLVALSCAPLYGVNSAEHFRGQLRALFRVLLEQCPQVTPVLKPHPRFKPSDLMEMLADLPGIDHVELADSGMETLDAIQEADLVLTDFSAVGVEAVLLRRSLVLLKSMWGSVRPETFLRTGIALVVDTPEDLPRALRDYREGGGEWGRVNEAVQRNIAELIAHPGESARRTAEALVAIVRKDAESLWGLRAIPQKLPDPAVR